MFLKYLLPCFILSMVIAQNTEKPLYFRKDYKLLNEFNAFYKYHKVRLNFSDAISICNAEGAKLFYPTSVEETNAVFAMINNPDQNELWIGAHDLFGESSFVTLTGVPLDETYSNWGLGQPDNVDGNENCVTLSKDTTFNDHNCDNKGNFVCSRSVVGLTQNPDCETYDTAYSYNIDMNKCYKLHRTPMKWKEAFRICRAEGSQLAILNNDVEAQYLVDELEKLPIKNLRGNFDKGQVHVGFNDLINQGIHLTIEGQPISETGYEKWGNNQPDNANDRERCGAMFRDGTLNDLDCEVRAMFFCEKTLTDGLPLKIENKQATSTTGGMVLLPDARK